jgi:probable F420-dependent oxidoreductase
MDIDANLNAPQLSEAGDLAVVAEEMGFDGVWVTERDHSPYTLSTQIAADTDTIDHGTGIAVAFPRSPMVTAYTAWDLAELSGARFILGLGTQVKGHIQRRFDAEWKSPGPQMRDYVRCLQHIWDAWAHEDEVDYHGEFYEIDSCPPDWRPDPIDHPDIPLYIAGVNDFNIQLAGHLCDGLHVHPVHSPEYIDQKVMPALERGAARADRDPEDVTLTTMLFAITGDTDAEREQAREAVRRQIGFYGSTRSYRRSSQSMAGKTSARRSTTSRWKTAGTNWATTSPMRCSPPSPSRAIGPNSATTSKSDTRTWTG